MKKAVAYIRMFDDIISHEMERLVEAFDLEGVLGHLNSCCPNDDREDLTWNEEEAGNFIIAWKSDIKNYSKS